MKKVLKWIGGIFVVLVIIGMITGGDEKSGKESGSSEEPAKAAREVVKLSAGELFKSYDENEVATDERLKGKDIQVSGTIQAIDKDAFDNIIINFRTSNEFMPARMKMNDSEKSTAISLKKGAKSIIQCQKMSRIVGTPYGSNCVFVTGS